MYALHSIYARLRLENRFKDTKIGLRLRVFLISAGAGAANASGSAVTCSHAAYAYTAARRIVQLVMRRAGWHSHKAPEVSFIAKILSALR